MKVVVKRRNYDIHGFDKFMKFKNRDGGFISSTSDPNEAMSFESVEDANKWLKERHVPLERVEHYTLEDGRLERISGEPINYII